MEKDGAVQIPANREQQRRRGRGIRRCALAGSSESFFLVLVELSNISVACVLQALFAGVSTFR